MNRRSIVLLLGALAGCASSSSPPSSASPTPVVQATPGPSAGPVDMPGSVHASPCPADARTAEGQSCTGEGTGCGDPATPGFGLICHDGSWQRGKLMTPPCCKK